MPDTPDNIFALDGRVAFVTGGGSGLGRHFATVLAGAGARVVIAGRRGDKLAETVAIVEDAGGEVCAVEMDVDDEAWVRRAFDRAEDRFGTIEILLNNAGIARPGRLLEISADDWDAVLATNLKGVHVVACEMARRLLATGQPGSIINIASILGMRVQAGLGSYLSAKAAVVHLTRAQALEWAGFGIRVNAIAPGYFPTEMNAGYFDTEAGQAMLSRIPAGRTGRPEELSGVLLLLASDASSYMTGSVIAVDGGHLCSEL
jgi:NAD(P)-dependent dehydrogenase (short-subunit alcohol dehydrogenase family)